MILQVYFLDYGNTEQIALTNLAHIPDSLLQLPEYAIPAALDGIAPTGGGEWSTEAVNTFSDLVVVPSCHVTVVGGDESARLVKLAINGESVSKTLIDSKCRSRSC